MIWVKPPVKKYRMMYGGEWRPVMKMYDASRTRTTLAMRAVVALLWMGPTEGAMVHPHPGEIVIDPDYRTTDWDDREVVKD